MKDVLAHLIAALQLFGVALLLLCAAGNVLLGNWNGVVLTLLGAVTLMLL